MTNDARDGTALAAAQRRNRLAFFVILALTAVAWFAADGGLKWRSSDIAVVGAMTAKAGAIFLVFMEMSGAHPLLKALAGIFAAALAVLYVVL